MIWKLLLKIRWMFAMKYIQQFQWLTKKKSLVEVPLSHDETDESKERFLPLVDELVDDVQNGLEEVVEAVEDVVEDLQDGLEEVVEAVEDVVEDVQDHSDVLRKHFKKKLKM